MDHSSPSPRVFKPQVFDPADPAQRSKLEKLKAGREVWAMHDRLHPQLIELMESRNPTVRELEPNQRGARLRELVENHLDGRALENYGRWVFYPWSGQLVHLLGPSEFRETRLDRNRNKITTEEQARLAELSVGIVGLSVGNAIALNLAMEGVGGHFKLADFDQLELANMNRLRASTHQLGLPKTILAARQILEIDPYLKVTLFEEGITADNIDPFLTDGPPLNVVVDECDSIAMKFLIRQRARALGLPVVMETSDRGMLDIERFDQEPTRPPFHGLVPDMDPESLESLPTEEKVRHVLGILGVDELSTSMGASLLEVERTIVTWPQLASDVLLGGASVTVALRHLALGKDLPSGRRHLDIESQINTCHPLVEPQVLAATPVVACSPAPCLDPLIEDLIQEAALAPSGGNAQPWHFYVDDHVVWITLNRMRGESLLDRDGFAALTAIGACLENLTIAAAHRNHHTVEQLFPLATNPDVVARVEIRPGRKQDMSERTHLHAQLRSRHTNRKVAPSTPLTDQEVAGLRNAKSLAHAKLQVVRDPEHLARLGVILGQNERLRILNPHLGRELMSELRLEPTSEVEQGIALETCEFTELENATTRLLMRPDVRNRIAHNGGGQRLSEGLQEALASSSALCLLSSAGSEPEHIVRAGRAMQQIWLEATSHGLAIQPVGTLPYMARLLTAPLGVIYDTQEHQTLTQLHKELRSFFPQAKDQPALMLFRVHRAPPASARSRRLSLKHSVTLGRPEDVHEYQN